MAGLFSESQRMKLTVYGQDADRHGREVVLKDMEKEYTR